MEIIGKGNIPQKGVPYGRTSYRSDQIRQIFLFCGMILLCITMLSNIDTNENQFVLMLLGQFYYIFTKDN